MRIDEFEATPGGTISTTDKIRLWSIGFDLLPILITLCTKLLNSPITTTLNVDSLIHNELALNSPITKEMELDGNLCW